MSSLSPFSYFFIAVAMYDVVDGIVDCVKMMKMVIYRQLVEYNKLFGVNILTNTRLWNKINSPFSQVQTIDYIYSNQNHTLKGALSA